MKGLPFPWLGDRQLIDNKVHHSVYNKTKRLIDIMGAIIGLILTAILAIPIFIVIQFDDPGPILYRQTRCGLRGKPFQIWKFRSMIINADQQKHLIKNEAKGHIFKNSKDPRITKIGKFLRRSSLDEFPQFWNVLTGEMSLVGTRPPTPDEVEKYQPHHWQRLQVKPGLTGEWQVNGRSTVINFENVVKLDLDYQEKWSVVYDLKLIVQTIIVVLSCRGAC
ncbi:sugar transferase [Crocosphaera sp. UHCC 0190]|uniref:sugar transferase n=1 Tax=Crocosphaera sp. UHCC 0190 TaxID=3110246 RepID=UPI002B1EC061|nr:sugar transferase [Crocosphaera sp. UHCC 0190]MEA5510312.1 sugar transferase [Crocosphaera sp. UHCC 0190]